jgi:DNA-directed RNA polymerase subunit M/transcription elongation factor TFIIS
MEDSFTWYDCPNCGEKIFGARQVGAVRIKCQACGHISETKSGVKTRAIDLGISPAADNSLKTERCPVCQRRLCDCRDTGFLRIKCSKCRHDIVLGGGGAARSLGRLTY